MSRNHTITQVIADKLSDEELANLLPAQVVDIAQFIGFAKALLLIKGMGGVDFAVPRGLTANRSEREQRLVDAIGIEATKKFMQVFGGARLYIPRCEHLLREVRNRKFCECIDSAVDGGMTQTKAVQKFAYEFGMTERNGYKVLKRHRSGVKVRSHGSDDSQLGLFDDQF